MGQPALWAVFDRIKAGLDKQEALRGREGFEDWAKKARPLFEGYVAEVRQADEQSYGHVLCDWLDWLDDRGLAYRGELKWKIPTRGPLVFEPPTMDGLLWIARNLFDAMRAAATAPLAPSSSAPIPKTLGGIGLKLDSLLTVPP